MRSSPALRRAPSTTKRSALAAFLLTFAAAGCALPPDEEAESIEQGLTQLTSITPVYLPRVTRYLKVEQTRYDNVNECPVVCTDAIIADGYYIPQQCSPDCTTKYKRVLLSDSPSSLANNVGIGAHVNPEPREHHGCGVQAAQNMLAYYGDQLPIRDFLSAVDRISFEPFSDEIAVTPDALSRGLTTMIDSRGGQTGSVTRTSYVYDLRKYVIGELLTGNPPLVNVDDGDHWVMVVGWQDDPMGKNFLVVDYGWAEWKSQAELKFGNVLVPGYGGWYPRTVLSTKVASRPNLLTNGSFDQANTIAAPWRIEGDSWKGIDVALPDRSRTGRGNNAWIRATWGWNAITQTIPVQPNTWYALTGWIRGTTNIAHGYFGVRNAANQVVHVETRFEGNGEYKLLTVRFNSGANTALTAFAGYWAPGQDSWIQIDELNLSKNLFYLPSTTGEIDYSRQ